MKKFVQTALLFAGLGLTACASDDVWQPYGSRTAGHGTEAVVKPAPAATQDVDMEKLQMCMEREKRLLDMNKNCYRK